MIRLLMARMFSTQELKERREAKIQSKGGGGAITDDRNIGKSTPPPQPPSAAAQPPSVTQHAVWLPPGNQPIASPELLAQLAEANTKLQHLLKVRHYTQLYLPRLEMLVEVDSEIAAVSAEIERLHKELPRT